MTLRFMQIRDRSQLRRTKSYKIRQKRFRAELNITYSSSILVREVNLLLIKFLTFFLANIKTKMKQRMKKIKTKEMKARKKLKSNLKRQRKSRPR